MEDRSYGSGAPLVLGAAGVNLALAAAFALLAAGIHERDHPPPDLGGALGDVALFAVYAAPALVALLALRGRPVLFLAAAMLTFLLAFTAFSGVSLALLLPAGGYLVALLTAPPPTHRELVPVAVALVVIALGIAAFAVHVAGGEPVCWRYEVDARGEVTYEHVPVDEVSVVEGGRRVFSSSATLGGGAIEAGSGCEEQPTLPAALATLGLVALLLVTGARVPSPR